MKKIFSIALFALLVLGAVACTDLLDADKRNTDKRSTDPENIEGARVSLGFNVPMPIETKAMTAEPTIETIHVFVFIDNGVSENGVLSEVQKANPIGTVNANAVKDGEGNITNTETQTMIARWQVNLLMGRTKRRLHFVANLPADYTMPDIGDSEFSVLRSIQTTGGDVAYWQMKELENGVLAYTYDGTGKYTYVGSDGTTVTQYVDGRQPRIAGWKSYDANTGIYKYEHEGETYEVGKDDYITTEGHKVLDGKGFYASAEVSSAVSQIAMIRNFTSIKVLTTSNNFRLDSAVLINVPEFGYAAPFDDAHNSFVTAYRNATINQMPSHQTILSSGYPATIPSNSIVTDYPAKSSVMPALHLGSGSTARDSAILYMYERGLPTEHATSLLVKGRLNGSTVSRWFKIEISDESGQFFPMYRDFTYEVNIKSISGSDGYVTMAEAYEKPAIGDISSSPETTTLTKIDDGNGLTMWVEYIDHTSVSVNATQVTLLYKFYKGSNNYTSTVVPTIVTVDDREAAVTSVSTEAFTGPNTQTPDGSGGWYQATVYLSGMGEATETKVSDLHISGTVGAKTMYRDVTYRVITKQNFTLANTGLTSQTAGDTTTLSVTLPKYLGYSVFPLTLKIEAEANNLNPGDSEKNITVDSGSSLINSSKNSFYFLKTINYTQYLANPTFNIVFKTTRTGSTTNSNATWVYVADVDGYFNTGKTYISVN